MVERLANFGETTLAADLDGSQTTVTVSNGALFPSSGNYRIVVDEELMLVTARSTNDLTVTRGIESTSAVPHTIGSNVKAVLTAAGLSTAMLESYSGKVGRFIIPAGSELFADEFDDASLDGGWTRVDKSASSHLTWTEAGGVLSASHSSTLADGASGPAHALMRAMPGGQSYPFTVQVGLRHHSRYATNYQMLGPVMSNGIDPASGAQAWSMPYYSTSHGIQHSVRGFTNWLTAGNTTSGVIWDPFDFHVRLKWSAANTFTSEMSPNGVDWMDLISVSVTLTPTYFGIGYSNWGTTLAGIGTFYYVRTY